MRFSVPHLVLGVPALVLLLAGLDGCQACVVDSSQPEDPPSSRPAAVGSHLVRPRLMSPIATRISLRDAGDSDE